MSWIKTADDITHLREGGKRLARVVQTVAEAVVPGVTTDTLDALAERLIREGGDTPAFLHYKPRGAPRGFPATMCISINEEVVHGIPNEDVRTVQEGDIVSLDCGLVHNGLITDHAVSVIAGKGTPEDAMLLNVTRDALHAGIQTMYPGKHIGDISAAIEAYATPYGYGIVYELGGHGVGHAVHEPPYVPNVGDPGTGEKLEAGMVLAVEPMLNHGDADVVLLRDGYTFVTRDGSRSAHFEHSVLVTDSGPEILTRL
jgi:methionyl aminopeptidase